MEAIILAGGLGTRLRSVVSDLPKCMAPVAGHPFLQYLLEYLSKEKMTHVILSLGYKHELVEEWIAQYQWPFRISFSIEEEPLGTGGAVKLALGQATEEEVFILNGDTFFAVNLKDFQHFHQLKKSEFSIALKPMTQFDRYGNVETNSTEKIIAFREKQPCENGQINGGVYLMNRPSTLLPVHSERFSLESDVLQKKVGNAEIYGFVSSVYFIDIGIPEDFAKANIDFYK